MSHTNNTDLRNRLRRAQGHLATIVRMVEENRDGLATVQQLQAVVAALQKAKAVLIRDHIEHHLQEAAGPLSRETREQLQRLSDLAKYL